MTSVMGKSEFKMLNDGNGGCCANLDNTKANISKAIISIHQYQEKVRLHMNSKYQEFGPSHSSADIFLNQGETLLKESEQLLNNLQTEASDIIRDAKNDLSSYYNELQEVTLGMRVTNRILYIDDLFQQVEDAKSKKDYLFVLDLLGKLKDLIGSESNDQLSRVFQRCQCYDAIRIQLEIETKILMENLLLCFERLIQLNEKQFAQTKAITISVSKDVSQLQDIVLALFQAKYNPTEMCKFLYNNCFEPIILKPVSLEYIEETEYERLTLSYSLKSPDKDLMPSYKQVFEHIKTLLNCLKNINVMFNTEEYVFSIMGNHINSRFLTTLIDECLMNSIPETIDELQESTLREDIVNFEQTLADTFLIDIDREHKLTDFVDNFGVHFRERFFKKVLETSRQIMHNDLQDMTSVAAKNTPEEVSRNPALFPCCMVSKSTLALIKLFERILRQPKIEENSDVKDALDNISTVIPIILQEYLNEVPKYHAKLLESIPQQSALFYTNCMFLAHWAGTHYEAFEDADALVKCLQLTGRKHLNAQINNQQKIVMDILKEIDLSDIHTLGTVPMKLIRQCLRQLDLLKNVWQNVLPNDVFNEIFCGILNNFISDIIRRITSMEDISATLALEFSELISVILEKAPQLFKEKHEVIQIKSWMKLQQLKMILNASLLEITEQWCDGAGILTANYTAEEIRHLIRALFQNTDRRAQALAKIN